MGFRAHTEQSGADPVSATAELQSHIQQGASRALAERAQGQDTLPLGCGRLELRSIEAVFQQAATEAPARDDGESTRTRGRQRALLERLEVEQSKAQLQRRNAGS